MNYTPALHFDLTYDHRLTNNEDDIAQINIATHVLGQYEKIFAENNFDFERDVFHESRCALLKIARDNRLTKCDTYQVVKKETQPEEYIKNLAENYMKIDTDEESTTSIENVIKDFSGMDSTALSYIELLVNELVNERNNNND